MQGLQRQPGEQITACVCVYICVCLAECHGSCHPGQITILTHLGSNPSGSLIKPLPWLVTHTHTHTVSPPTHKLNVHKQNCPYVSNTHNTLYAVMPCKVNTQLSRQSSKIARHCLISLSNNRQTMSVPLYQKEVAYNWSLMLNRQLTVPGSKA